MDTQNELNNRRQLVEHANKMHKRLNPNWSTARLRREHAREHHRYYTNHYHEGENTGADNRPRGWYDGTGVVRNV